jgi:hypothetical protein
MQVLYRRGYDPEEIVDVTEITADRTLGGPAWLRLHTVEGHIYEATFFQQAGDHIVAGLPEGW